jgi:hypothetical protein
VTSAVAQLRALAWLRWQMVRSPGTRFAMCLTPLLLIWLVQLAVHSGTSLTQPAFAAALALAPSAFLGFGVLAVIAPLTAGGGNEIVPSSQLVVFPVRPRTYFLGGLLLAPVNLVWVAQLLVLAAETSYLTRGGNSIAGGITTTTFVVSLTIAGQAIAWTVVGLRQTRTGRRLVAGFSAALLVTAVVVIRGGLGDAVLAASPTHSVVRAIQVGPGSRWLLTTGTLLVAAVLGLIVGARACGWALARPNDATTTGTSAVRRRAARRTALAELIAIDRASVWRSTALRRGGFVLAVLPGLAALGAAVPWRSLVVLPGLVAAGAGLLFGINAFSLDGGGAVWLASLPHDPRLIARAKVWVLVETVFASMAVVLVAGSIRTPGPPSAAQVTAILSAAVAGGAMVVATCLALSVRRPHRADLAGPRDAVAPPGALTLASVRLALPPALIGLVVEGASHSGDWWTPAVVAAPIALLAVLWLRRSLGRYADPLVRSRIVQTVSAG